MKKILILFAAIFLSVGAFGQDLTKTNTRMMLDTLNTKLAKRDTVTLSNRINAAHKAWIDSANYYMRTFNILDYGAISGDSISDVVAIQAAIDAAYDSLRIVPGYQYGYAGKVIIPPGEWYIDDTVMLKSYVHVDVGHGARFHFPPTYDGVMWSKETDELLTFSKVNGGFYDFGYDGLGTAIYLNSTLEENRGQSNDFSDMYIHGGKHGILLEQTSPGYTCCNNFSNIKMTWFQKYIKVFSNSNHFNDIWINIGSNSDHDTLFNIQGDYNNFNQVRVYDWNNSPGMIPIYIKNGNYQNVVNMEGIKDTITPSISQNNIIIGDGIVRSTTFNADGIASNSDGYGSLVFNKMRYEGGGNVTGDNLGKIVAKGFHTGAYYDAAHILFGTSGTPGVSDMPGNITFAVSADGSSTPTDMLSLYQGDRVRFSKPAVPTTDGLTSLGTTTYAWNGLYLNTGTPINWESGDVTLTHSSNTLTLAGGDLALGANNLTMTGSLAATGSRVTKGWFTNIESTNMPTVGGVTIKKFFDLKVDTIPLFVFGGGGGNTADTTVFGTSTIYGSFYNSGTDTLVVTELRCIMLGETGDTLQVDINWNATLDHASPTQLNTDPLPVGRPNGLTTGTTDTSFDNAKIPPGVWVWCETPYIALTKKPKYFNAQITGYKIRNW